MNFKGYFIKAPSSIKKVTAQKIVWWIHFSKKYDPLPLPTWISESVLHTMNNNCTDKIGFRDRDSSIKSDILDPGLEIMNITPFEQPFVL